MTGGSSPHMSLHMRAVLTRMQGARPMDRKQGGLSRGILSLSLLRHSFLAPNKGNVTRLPNCPPRKWACFDEKVGGFPAKVTAKRWWIQQNKLQPRRTDKRRAKVGTHSNPFTQPWQVLHFSAYSYRNDEADMQKSNWTRKAAELWEKNTGVTWAPESPSSQSVSVECGAMTVQLRMMS